MHTQGPTPPTTPPRKQYPSAVLSESGPVAACGKVDYVLLSAPAGATVHFAGGWERGGGGVAAAAAAAFFCTLTIGILL